MRRTCYMEWNKGVTAVGRKKEDGGKGGVVARKRRAEPRGILRRITHVHRICVQDGKTGMGTPCLTAPLHFNRLSPQERVLRPEINGAANG